MGAIASGGARVLSRDVIDVLGISQAQIEAVAVREQAELERRERAYRGARPAAPLHGRTVLLVDDGLATGATMRAAVRSLRAHEPARIVVAVPVGAPETCAELRDEADEVVCATLARAVRGGRLVVRRLLADERRRGARAARARCALRQRRDRRRRRAPDYHGLHCGKATVRPSLTVHSGATGACRR